MISFLSHTYRKNLHRARVAFCTIIALAMSQFGTAYAQNTWPAQQPINLIVSYSPGGGTDITARILAPFLEKYLGNNARIGDCPEFRVQGGLNNQVRV